MPIRAMSGRWIFIGVGILAMLAGTGLWLAQRDRPAIDAPRIDAAALFASTFQRLDGTPVALGRYAGRVLVLNFWATWCAPCRAEMPAFNRVQESLGSARVQFVGLTRDDPVRVKRFASEVPVSYPLLVGGPDVDALAAALGDHDRVLPFTAVFDARGRVIAQHVGAYSEEEIARLVVTAMEETASK